MNRFVFRTSTIKTLTAGVRTSACRANAASFVAVPRSFAPVPRYLSTDGRIRHPEQTTNFPEDKESAKRYIDDLQKATTQRGEDGVPLTSTKDEAFHRAAGPDDGMQDERKDAVHSGAMYMDDERDDWVRHKQGEVIRKMESQGKTGSEGSSSDTVLNAMDKGGDSGDMSREDALKTSQTQPGYREEELKTSGQYKPGMEHEDPGMLQSTDPHVDASQQPREEPSDATGEPREDPRPYIHDESDQVEMAKNSGYGTGNPRESGKAYGGPYFEGGSIPEGRAKDPSPSTQRGLHDRTNEA